MSPIPSNDFDKELYEREKSDFYRVIDEHFNGNVLAYISFILKSNYIVAPEGSHKYIMYLCHQELEKKK